MSTPAATQGMLAIAEAIAPKDCPGCPECGCQWVGTIIGPGLQLDGNVVESAICYPRNMHDLSVST
jgi:hypothetical protein